MFQALALSLPFLTLPAAEDPPYDFAAAEALLEAELPDLADHVAVILRQNGRDLFRFQHGDIDFDTKTRLASLTKTISAGVILSCVEDGSLQFSERLGDGLALFEREGVGDPTLLECWSMRHGLQCPRPFERLSSYDHGQSVALIGLTGSLAFPPGTQLGYDGKGMQSVGLLAAQRNDTDWESLARERILGPCDMPDADYRQFDPNPAVAGGLRASALEVMRFAEMVIDGGRVGDGQVLSPASIERLFVNHTRGLPVHAAPFPESHPLYPYGVQPDYGFGDWILAENPASRHVEEVVGAGAWGSYLWIDRRRGLTAVLVTDVPAGSQASMDAALGLCAIARQEVESKQVRRLFASAEGGGAASLRWEPVDGATRYLVYGSQRPIRDVHDLARAEPLERGPETFAQVRAFPHYAVTASFGDFENLALAPGRNAVALTL